MKLSKREKKREHKCEYCGHEAMYNDRENPVKFTSDPYDSEILEDYTQRYICEKCYNLQCEEI